MGLSRAKQLGMEHWRRKNLRWCDHHLGTPFPPADMFMITDSMFFYAFPSPLIQILTFKIIICNEKIIHISASPPPLSLSTLVDPLPYPQNADKRMFFVLNSSLTFLPCSTTYILTLWVRMKHKTNLSSFEKEKHQSNFSAQKIMAML